MASSPKYVHPFKDLFNLSLSKLGILNKKIKINYCPFKQFFRTFLVD